MGVMNIFDGIDDKNKGPEKLSLMSVPETSKGHRHYFTVTASVADSFRLSYLTHHQFPYLIVGE